ERNKQYPYVTSSTTADPWLYLFRWSPLYPLGNDENGEPIRSPASEAAAASTASLLNKYMNLNLGGTLKLTDNWTVDADYTYANDDHMWDRRGARSTARVSAMAPIVRLDEAGYPIYVNAAGQVVSGAGDGAMPAYDLLSHTYTAPGANSDH